jgi:hypothetical protein
VTERDAWLALFPRTAATQAVDALCVSWNRLADRYKPEFNHKTYEHRLTRRLVFLLRSWSDDFGLMGHWGSEQEVGDINPDTGELIDPKRTDIQYQWNDSERKLELVFEFKKLNSQSNSRRNYAKEGICRFVDGQYSKRQPVALMVGILTEPHGDCVPPLVKSLTRPAMKSQLSLRHTVDGKATYAPSTLFPEHAEFDTEHTRPPELGPTHGTIRIAHLFLEFAYPPSVKGPNRKRIQADLDNRHRGKS